MYTLYAQHIVIQVNTMHVVCDVRSRVSWRRGCTCVSEGHQQMLLPATTILLVPVKSNSMATRNHTHSSSCSHIIMPAPPTTSVPDGCKPNRHIYNIPRLRVKEHIIHSAHRVGTVGTWTNWYSHYSLFQKSHFIVFDPTTHVCIWVPLLHVFWNVNEVYKYSAMLVIIILASRAKIQKYIGTYFYIYMCSVVHQFTTYSYTYIIVLPRRYKQ